MNCNGHIEIEKITDCIDTLSSVENLINYKDLSLEFEELEDYFKHINFEHTYCLFYKDYINKIYENLEYIKRKINELTESLRTTKITYNSSTEIATSEISKITDSFTNAASSIATDIKSAITTQGNVSVIPQPEIPTEQPPVINTVPIGIAIGATGIAGSAGAIVINEMFGKKDEEEKIEPYQAIRHNREVDRFYGSEYQDIILEDDDQDTNDFDDDFYE